MILCWGVKRGLRRGLVSGPDATTTGVREVLAGGLTLPSGPASLCPYKDKMMSGEIAQVRVRSDKGRGAYSSSSSGLLFLFGL